MGERNKGNRIQKTGDAHYTKVLLNGGSLSNGKKIFTWNSLFKERKGEDDKIFKFSFKGEEDGGLFRLLIVEMFCKETVN